MIPQHFTLRALAALRWAILFAMLTITLIWPFTGRSGHPVWIMVLVFCGYNLTVSILQRRVPWLRSFAHVAWLDLPVAAVLYFLDYTPGGPLFVLFYLGLVSAGATMSVRGAISYAAAVIALVVGIAPTLPGWSASQEDLRQLAARALVFALVGIGAAVLNHRLQIEMRAAEVHLAEATRLEELDRLRGQVVANITHDLKTPLTAIRAALGMLTLRADDHLHDDERQLIANARRNTDRLGLMIDDLLTDVQLEAGTFALEQSLVDLRAVVADAVAAVFSLIQEKDQQLEIDLPAALVTNGDPWQLGKAVVNLLANAHRHTPRATRILVTGQCTDHEITLTVRDTGPGIPATELANVFDRFYQRASGGIGAGLGLPIAKAIVESHAGHIRVESTPGDGTAFIITLPAASPGRRL